MEAKIILASIALEELVQKTWLNLIGNPAENYTKLPVESVDYEDTLINYCKNNIPMFNVVAPRETWKRGIIATKFDTIVIRS